MPKETGLLKRRRIVPQHFDIRRILPNIVTLGALCSGFSAVYLALGHQWDFAVGAILLAAILDTLDGRLARLMHSESTFGVELDSLADFINFGAAPALVVYLHTLERLQRFGWIVVLFYVVCMGLRLARFNTLTHDGGSTNMPKKYFVGVPAPAGAFLALLPLILTLQFPELHEDLEYAYVAMMIIVASLLVSKVPTFSFKAGKIDRKWVLPLLLASGLILAGLVTALWFTLTLLAFGYIALIPVSIRSYYRFKKSENGTAL